MEYAITAEVNANYCDQNVPNDNIKVNWSDEFADEIWFNIKLTLECILLQHFLKESQLLFYKEDYP